MKITITYYNDAHFQYPCNAKAVVNERTLIGFGRTYQEARTDLLERATIYLKKLETTPPPPDETIDIDISGD